MRQLHQAQRQLKLRRPQRSLHRAQESFEVSAEMVTFAIASLIVAVLIGLVIFVWVTESHEDPILAVTRDEAIEEHRGAYYVPFTVTNEGGGTAEAVEIVAELRLNGEIEETGQQMIDFLSSKEEEEGVFIFRTNPADGDLSVRAASYKMP